MLWTAFLERSLRRVYGELPPVEPAAPSLILVADGVGGADLCSHGLKYAALWSGARVEVRGLGWGHGFGRWYADLSETAWHQAQAERLAVTVQAAREAGRAVFLVGKSGGAGIAVWGLERLPPASVEAAVLLAPALSPRYDLTRALQAVRGRLTVFHSPLDVFILGAGTRIFGTIDRVRSVAAGLHGFQCPAGLPDAGHPYERLHQIRWSPAMSRTGYLGGHVGPDLPGFLRRYVLPCLEIP